MATDRTRSLPAGAGPFLLHFARRRLALAVVLGLVVTGAAGSAVASQYALKLLIDAMAAVVPALADVYRWLALLLLLLASESLFFRLGGWLGSRMVIGLGSDIRSELFARAMARPWRFFHRHHSGALAGRIAAAGQSATSAVSTLVWNVVPPAADLLGSIVVLATIKRDLAVGLVVAALALTTMLHRWGGRGFSVHRAFHQKAAGVMGEIGDVLTHVMLVKSYGAAARERGRIDESLAHETRLHGRSWMFLERLRLMHDLSFWLVAAILLAVAVRAWSRHEITTGDVVVVMTLSLRVINGSRELALALLGFARQLGSITEAIDVFDDRSAAEGVPEAGEGGRPLQVAGGAVSFRDVWFSPDGRRPLLRGFDLEIPAGQKLGIVGASGAGKSTLLRLMQRLLVPDHGSILIDGHPIAEASEQSLAAAIASVTQEVELLHRSLRENLCYGDPEASQAELDLAAEAAGCQLFISALPEGYDAVAGERGVMLSGGQRQRLALARALLKRSPILLLDEATSALDTASERAAQAAMLERAHGRTVIAVAHRLSTVMEFDRIVVIQNGAIVEDGTPNDLRKGFGPFARMWRAQMHASLEPASLAG